MSATAHGPVRTVWLHVSRVTTAVAPRVRLRSQSVGDTAGAARDLLNQALELLSSKATPAEVTSAARFLRAALDQEPTFGDAHYYRQLCLKRLNQDPAVQRRHLESAELYESEALRDRRDPFTLAAIRVLASLSASLVVALLAIEPGADIAALWNAASLEEEWQAELWGREWEAEERRARRFDAFALAARFAGMARAA